MKERVMGGITFTIIAIVTIVITTIVFGSLGFLTSLASIVAGFGMGAYLAEP